MLIDLSDVTKTQYELQRKRQKDMAKFRTVISYWSKVKLQKYVYNNIKAYRVTDAGMSAILERFINTNEFAIGTLSEELKAGFDIVRSIAKNTKINIETTDLIYGFIKHYEDVIRSYDRQSAQTYYHKLIADYRRSVEMVNKKIEIEEDLRVKY